MPQLFDPLTVRGLTVRNRIWMSPMCEYAVTRRMACRTTGTSCTSRRRPGRRGAHPRRSDRRDAGGAHHAPRHGIWNDAQVAAWRRITDFVHGQGAAIGLQLAHAGRKAGVWAEWGVDGRKGSVPLEEGGWQTDAPSAIAFDGHAAPRALETDEIRGSSTPSGRGRVARSTPDSTSSRCMRRTATSSTSSSPRYRITARTPTEGRS